MGLIREATGGEAHPFTPGNVLDGRFELKHSLGHGEGAMGEVFLADDQWLERRVVVKTIRRELLAADPAGKYRDRFNAEVRAAAALAHPNIVTIHDYRAHDYGLYCVMAHIDGAVSMRQRVLSLAEDGERLPLDEALAYALHAAEGLRFAHARGIIHRDVKPENLLVFRTGAGAHLVILDFGVAHLPWNPITRMGSLPGTAGFIAPEAVHRMLGADDIEVDCRADLFGLGATLHFALTGQEPFCMGSYLESLQAVCLHEPALPSTMRPGLPAFWDIVVRGLLQKDPEARIESAEQLLSMLQQKESLTGPVPDAVPLKRPLVLQPRPSPSVELPDAPVQRFCDPGPFQTLDGPSTALLTRAWGDGGDGGIGGSEGRSGRGGTELDAETEPDGESLRSMEEPAVPQAEERPATAAEAGSAALRPTDEGGAAKAAQEARPTDVAAYAQALHGSEKKGFSGLPRASRVGMVLAAAALLALPVAALLPRAERAAQSSTPAVIRSADAQAQAVAVTPEEILRDQAAARRRLELAPRAEPLSGPAQAAAASRGEEQEGAAARSGAGVVAAGKKAAERERRTARSGRSQSGARAKKTPANSQVSH